MCFPYDAKPPIRPLAGAAVDSRHIELTSSADGTVFDAFEARAEQPSGPGVIVLPDVRGLFPFYEELALRFAEAGIDAVTIDYFARTASRTPRGEDFEFMPHIQQMTARTVAGDVRAAVEHLRQMRNDPQRALFTLGFCFGGSTSWLQAAEGHGLAGVIGFYGMPSNKWFPDSGTVLERVGEFECPVLGLMGGADRYIPNEEGEKLERALTEAGVEHEIHTYEGAPHSFFDRSYEQHAKESEDAWRRCLEFIERNSQRGSGQERAAS